MVQIAKIITQKPHRIYQNLNPSQFPFEPKYFVVPTRNACSFFRPHFPLRLFLIFGIFSSCDSSRRLWGNESIVPPLRCGHGLVPVSRSTHRATYSRIYTPTLLHLYTLRGICPAIASPFDTYILRLYSRS